jgi:hypothetical protein
MWVEVFNGKILLKRRAIQQTATTTIAMQFEWYIAAFVPNWC